MRQVLKTYLPDASPRPTDGDPIGGSNPKIRNLKPKIRNLKPKIAMPYAARIGDITTAGATITGPGISHIQIAGKAAAVQGDSIQGTTFRGTVAAGSSRILIAGRPAAYVGCSATGTNPSTGASATTVINTGDTTVQYINP
ncbi:MAG: PAAR domain-containing protein [Cyanobacteria bacterium P01_A01_bin.37]